MCAANVVTDCVREFFSWFMNTRVFLLCLHISRVFHCHGQDGD